MSNNRHKNRRALVVRLDKTCQTSAWFGSKLEGMILYVTHCIEEDKYSKSFYAGEILYLPPDAIDIAVEEIGLIGDFTVLVSRAFTAKERKITKAFYGKNHYLEYGDDLT